MDKRLIEETIPIKDISEISASEKYIRQGYISTLHIWWARRPLAASRATAYAALISASKTNKELEAEKKFIVQISKWVNSNNVKLINQARENILKSNGGTPPKVLDPFGGGGSIPLECLRLGCETYSNDINPVAVLVQKAILEYPSKYGKPGISIKSSASGVHNINVENKLLEDVKYWGSQILSSASSEIEQFYPSSNRHKIIVGYFWAKTVPCQNPACSIEIPLLRQLWLANNSRRKIFIELIVGKNQINYKLNNYSKATKINPSQGTVKRAIVTCPACKSTIDAKKLKKLFKSGKASQKMIAAVELNEKGIKEYRLINSSDIEQYHLAQKHLKIKVSDMTNRLGINPLPDEELPENMTGCIAPPNYGITRYGDLFNNRQQLALITFLDKIREIYDTQLLKKYDLDYRKAIMLYLSLSLDWLANKYSTIAFYDTKHETITQTFNMQTIPMNWDYMEINPFNPSTGGFKSNMYFQSKVIDHCSFSSSTFKEISQFSATKIPYEDNFFDAIITDPPYYNSVPYADLSDFFYVWLKRSIGFLFPEYFTTSHTPKNNEIAELSGWDPVRYSSKDKHFFESNLRKSFQEIYRVLKPNAIAIIVYAHKSTSGWETLINSLLDSNLVVSGAWPISTEMQKRMRAKESAALTSSIYLVCRKIKRAETTFYSDIKDELKKYLEKKLDFLWNEGITGADFFIAAIGTAIEVFGKYNQVMDYEGKPVRADRLLQDVRVLVTDYAVHKILHNGFAGDISDLTRLYVLYRWEFGTLKVEFDEANKLAHSCHIDLENEWNKSSSFIQKSKEFISILGPQDRDIEDLEDSTELIDVLHLSLKYWEKNRKTELNTLLRVSGFGKSDAFFRVAQAIAETLLPDNKEKQLLEGFLNLREKIISTVSEAKTKYDQGKFEFSEDEE